MIRYNLVCEAAHSFECWFPSSESYDTQIARGLVSCPTCGTTTVFKAMMAPRVARKDRVPPPATSGPLPERPVTLISEPERTLREAIKALHAHVAATSEHVGARFAEEARKIHYGEAEGRSIHGQASLDEARALFDEGIEVAPLPFLPDDRN
ncbi:DUF1178 family protein [Methylobacterium persicinum]|uniref:DUF1178 family protein n=1 Tax=Methylobacterium persicinum TaxID=374426 RepID=UPI001EE38D0A|nr:DUF1178 family protein [Methylobacterium persicinum]GJE37999.1 hypothetical protein KHHGKMAE_2064 [Methylobacterium persicinum]